METAKLLYLGNAVLVMPSCRVRVTRTLVFEGPAEWVAATLQRAWLEKGRAASIHGGPLEDGRTAVETSRVVEVL